MGVSRACLCGGLRAGTLAFAIRSGVNLILLLERRIQRARARNVPRLNRRTRVSLVQRALALFGKDSFRFGAMLGSFGTLYRVLLNTFPLLFPVNAPLCLNSRSLTEQSESLSPSAPLRVNDSNFHSIGRDQLGAVF